MTKRTKAYFDALSGTGAFTETALDDLTDSVAFKVDGASGTDTGAIQAPYGTEAQRPGTPVKGMFRFNDDADVVEFYDGTRWVLLPTTVEKTAAWPAVSAVASVKWRAPADFTIKNVYAVRTGGTSSSINVQVNGVDVLGSDYSVTTSFATPGASSVAVAAGDTITFEIAAISGEQALSIQIVGELA